MRTADLDFLGGSLNILSRARLYSIIRTCNGFKGPNFEIGSLAFWLIKGSDFGIGATWWFCLLCK